MSEYTRGGPYYDDDPNDPRAGQPEIAGEFDRPPYAPVPLNPYELTKDGVPYVSQTLKRITTAFEKNLAALPEDREPSTAVVELLLTSVQNTLFTRFDNNSQKEKPKRLTGRTAELYDKACLGSANVEELIELLCAEPNEIGSIELAHETHPFQWETTSMDVEVDDALHEAGFEMRGENGRNVRYYLMRTDDPSNPSAAIFVRKADIGVVSVEGGGVLVVQRDSMVLDLDLPEMVGVREEICEWQRRLSQDCNRQKETGSRKQLLGNKKTAEAKGTEKTVKFLDDQFATAIERRSEAIYPGVRSYYAFYQPDITGK